LYLRVWKDHGQVESAPGVPYELATLYAEADLGSLANRPVPLDDPGHHLCDGNRSPQDAERCQQCGHPPNNPAVAVVFVHDGVPVGAMLQVCAIEVQAAIVRGARSPRIDRLPLALSAILIPSPHPFKC